MAKLPIAATLLAISAPIVAQTLTAADQADGRCVVAMMTMSEKTKGVDKASFEAGMMYFLGKLAGRSGRAAIGPATGAAVASVAADAAPTLALTCAQEIEATTNAM